MATTTTTSQIDPALLPFLTTGLERAQSLFLTGQQPEFFPGQTFVSPSAATTEAIAQQEALARQQSPVLQQAQQAFMQGLTAQSAASPLYQNIFGAAGMQPGASVYQQAASGQLPVAGQAELQSLYGAAGAQPGQNVFGAAAGGGFQNIATGQLANIAGGGFLGGNPYQQQMMAAATRPLIQQFGETVLPGISSLYSRSGRLGSGSMERALERSTEAFGRSLGDVTANLAGTQFQQERALQQQALGQLAGVSAQDIQTRLAGASALEQAQRAATAQQAGIAGQLAGLSQQDIANRFLGAQGLQQAQQAALGTQLQAAGGLGTVQSQDLARQLAAASAAPQIYSQQFLPSQTLAQVGAQQEAIAAQPLQEQLSRYQFQQQLPYQQLQGFLSSVYGTPLGGYGTTTQNAPTYQNRSAGILGGALAGGLGGYALGQAFPAIGQTFGSSFAAPALGALGGGLLGGFF
jgi:hypothetical protein